MEKMSVEQVAERLRQRPELDKLMDDFKALTEAEQRAILPELVAFCKNRKK